MNAWWKSSSILRMMALIDGSLRGGVCQRLCLYIYAYGLSIYHSTRTPAGRTMLAGREYLEIKEEEEERREGDRAEQTLHGARHGGRTV